MRKSFDIEQINLDDLIATAMDDKAALGDEIKALKGLSITDLHAAYKQFCKNERVENSPVDLSEVIAFYNSALKDLPDAQKLKGMKLPGMSQILDGKGARFTEVFTPENRRVWVPISEIPESVRNAFIAAEDKRFMQHRGVDERGLVRAFIGNMAQPGRPQGGSTITQQLAKTLLVGNDVTYERKLREIIIASNIERTLSKTEILELYLNSIYLGRGAWGIEMAARGYFGKSASALTPTESAMIAGLAKGPSYFNPDRNLERARDRFNYVLGRMLDEKFISAEQAKAPLPQMIAYERIRPDIGFHFVDQVQREAKTIPGYRCAERVFLCRAHNDQSAASARNRNDLAGRARALRAEYRPLQVSGPGSPSLRRHPGADQRQEADRSGLARGAEDGAAAALRRALGAGAGGRERPHQEGRRDQCRDRGWPHPAAQHLECEYPPHAQGQ